MLFKLLKEQRFGGRGGLLFLMYNSGQETNTRLAQDPHPDPEKALETTPCGNFTNSHIVCCLKAGNLEQKHKIKINIYMGFLSSRGP